MKRTRSGAAVLLSLTTVMGTAGCYQGEGKTVTSQKPSGNGTTFTVSDQIQVQGLTIVADGKGNGSIVMTVINNGDEADALLTLSTDPSSNVKVTQAKPTASPSAASPAASPPATQPASASPTASASASPTASASASPTASASASPTASVTATPSGLIDLPAGQAVEVGGPGGTALALSGLKTTPGHYASVALAFGRAGSAREQVLVVPSTGFYAAYGPGASASATAAPTPGPTGEATQPAPAGE